MKPYYILTITAVLCFALLGFTTAFLFSEDTGGEEQKKKSTEELAVELDKALGIQHSEKKPSSSEHSSKEKQEQSDRKDKEKNSEERPISEAGNEDLVYLSENKEQESSTSHAIYRAPEKGTISVDTLLELIKE